MRQLIVWLQRILNKGMGHSPVLVLPQCILMAIWVCVLVPNGTVYVPLLQGSFMTNRKPETRGLALAKKRIIRGLRATVPSGQCTSKEE